VSNELLLIYRRALSTKDDGVFSRIESINIVFSVIIILISPMFVFTIVSIERVIVVIFIFSFNSILILYIYLPALRRFSSSSIIILTSSFTSSISAIIPTSSFNSGFILSLDAFFIVLFYFVIIKLSISTFRER